VTGAVDTIAEVVEETLAHARLDSPIRALAISGSPRSPSKSKALAQALLDALEKIGCETRLVDAAALPAEALLARETAADIEEALAAIGHAQIVAAASPTYRALYTGVLKCLFDLMPQDHLAGKVCLGLQTGIAVQHALAPDYGMRPLFASLGGIPALVLYATDDEFADGRPGDGLFDRLARMAEQAVQLAKGVGPGEA